MRRSTLLILASALVCSSLRVQFARAQACSLDMIVSPLSGAAPLTVHVGGGATGWVLAIGVDMGGEASYIEDLNFDPYGWDCRIGYSYAVDHEFFCPGTYEIVAFDADYPTVRRTASVMVSPPLMPYLFAFVGESAYEAYLATHVPVADRPFDHSTVDWGDGTIETFTWTRRGLYVGTPNHLYSADGQYTARVTHHYIGQYCSYDQTMTVNVPIPGPGTPIRPTTWGSVKALYRD